MQPYLIFEVLISVADFFRIEEVIFPFLISSGVTDLFGAVSPLSVLDLLRK
jgi:hypothetical protein